MAAEPPVLRDVQIIPGTAFPPETPIILPPGFPTIPPVIIPRPPGPEEPVDCIDEDNNGECDGGNGGGEPPVEASEPAAYLLLLMLLGFMAMITLRAPQPVKARSKQNDGR